VFRFLPRAAAPALFSVLTFLSCATVSAVDGLPLAAAVSPGEVVPVWRPLPLPAGETEPAPILHFSGRVSEPRLEFHALRIDLSDPRLRIAVAGGGITADGGTAAIRVSSFVRDRGLVAGINALPFDPVSGREGEPRTNIGVVIADGVSLSPPHRGFDALVFLADGSAAIVDQGEMGALAGVSHAVGGFGRVLEAGEPSPRVLDLSPRHPRSAAGVSPCGTYLYILAADGRRPASVGATELELALLLRALGASDGINFDGGGSTALALRLPDGTVRIANTPIHGGIPGRERAVAGVLGFGITDGDVVAGR